jgi:hypothetical protein
MPLPEVRTLNSNFELPKEAMLRYSNIEQQAHPIQNR